MDPENDGFTTIMYQNKAGEVAQSKIIFIVPVHSILLSHILRRGFWVSP